MVKEIDVFGIPLDFLMPPIFAFGANVVSGVTNFGDGVFFIICWNLFGEFGPVDEKNYTYIDAILYSSMLPLASIPALVYAAQTEMWLTTAYGTFLSVTSAFTSVLGVWFLLYVNPKVAEVCAGVLFCAFTIFKLVPAMLVLGVTRRDEQRVESHGNKNPLIQKGATGNAGEGDEEKELENLELDESETIVLGDRANTHWKSLEPLFEKHPGLKSAIEKWLPQISESLAPVETVALALLGCGLASGFLGGLIGTGSPAQLVVFANLDMTKGSMRGVKVQATIVSNVIRLVAIALTPGSTAFKASKWPVYLAVCICSLAGCTLGTWMRIFVNKEWLMILLYWLLWFTSADLMGVENNIGSKFSILYYIVTLALLVGTVICYLNPTEVETSVAVCKRTCSTDSKQRRKSTAPMGTGRLTSASSSRSLHQSFSSTSRKSIVRDLDEWEG